MRKSHLFILLLVSLAWVFSCVWMNGLISNMRVCVYKCVWVSICVCMFKYVMSIHRWLYRSVCVCISVCLCGGFCLFVCFSLCEYSSECVSLFVYLCAVLWFYVGCLPLKLFIFSHFLWLNILGSLGSENTGGVCLCVCMCVNECVYISLCVCVCDFLKIWNIILNNNTKPSKTLPLGLHFRIVHHNLLVSTF